MPWMAPDDIASAVLLLGDLIRRLEALAESDAVPLPAKRFYRAQIRTAVLELRRGESLLVELVK